LQKRVQWILRHVKGPRVLDIGCAGYLPDASSAWWLHGRLYSLFPQVVGIDYDEKIVRDLAAMGYQRIHHADAQSFKLAERFDTIVAGEVIEHLPNPGVFLERARHHLAPGGRLIVTTPSVFSLAHFLYALVHFPHTCPNPGHTGWFCLETLARLAALNGFRIRSWDLLEDYRFDVPAPLYRLFIAALSIMRPLIPKRLRANTLAFILEPNEDTPRP
jgi:2-polyprenyl-3-methyl-5-hydroxy-6-metoxy-1,4-benzoquinol methylase